MTLGLPVSRGNILTFSCRWLCTACGTTNPRLTLDFRNVVDNPTCSNRLCALSFSSAGVIVPDQPPDDVKRSPETVHADVTRPKAPTKGVREEKVFLKRPCQSGVSAPGVGVCHAEETGSTQSFGARGGGASDPTFRPLSLQRKRRSGCSGALAADQVSSLGACVKLESVCAVATPPLPTGRCAAAAASDELPLHATGPAVGSRTGAVVAAATACGTLIPLSQQRGRRAGAASPLLAGVRGMGLCQPRDGCKQEDFERLRTRQAPNEELEVGCSSIDSAVLATPRVTPAPEEAARRIALVGAPADAMAKSTPIFAVNFACCSNSIRSGGSKSASMPLSVQRPKRPVISISRYVAQPAPPPAKLAEAARQMRMDQQFRMPSEMLCRAPACVPPEQLPRADRQTLEMSAVVEGGAREKREEKGMSWHPLSPRQPASPTRKGLTRVPSELPPAKAPLGHTGPVELALCEDGEATAEDTGRGGRPRRGTPLLKGRGGRPRRGTPLKGREGKSDQPQHDATLTVQEGGHAQPSCDAPVVEEEEREEQRIRDAPGNLRCARCKLGIGVCRWVGQQGHLLTAEAPPGAAKRR